MGHLAKWTLSFLLVAVACQSGESTVANFLADRALQRIMNWISAGGDEWLSFPGHRAQGLNKTKDGFYTLALAGPKVYGVQKMIRTGDAHMDEDQIRFPLNMYSQNLTLQLAMKNLTLQYRHIAYTDDEGLRNFTAKVTTGGVLTNLTITIGGRGTKCVASAADAVVSYRGDKEIIDQNYQSTYYPMVDDAISYHFDRNIGQALEVFMYAAIVNIFDRYDICQDRDIVYRNALLKLKSVKFSQLDMSKV